MTEPALDPTPPADAPLEDPPLEVDTPPEDADPDHDDPDEDRHTRESQRLRKRARDAEGERDTATAAVDGLRRQLAEQAVAGQLHRPAALWAAGVDPASLFDADGYLDPAAVTAAVDRAVTTLGLSRRVAHQPGQGRTHDAPAPGNGWSDLIGKAVHG